MNQDNATKCSKNSENMFLYNYCCTCTNLPCENSFFLQVILVEGRKREKSPHPPQKIHPVGSKLTFLGEGGGDIMIPLHKIYVGNNLTEKHLESSHVDVLFELFNENPGLDFLLCIYFYVSVFSSCFSDFNSCSLLHLIFDKRLSLN